MEMKEPTGKEKVMVFLNKKGRVYKAGDPARISGKEMEEATKAGDTIKTITLNTFRKLKWAD